MRSWQRWKSDRCVREDHGGVVSSAHFSRMRIRERHILTGHRGFRLDSVRLVDSKILSFSLDKPVVILPEERA